MQSTRVLLVEDDPSLRRFVSLALDEPGITLIPVPGVREALLALHEEPVDLILTDLMMAGASGFTLLDTLRDQPELQAKAKVAVFSAGLNAEVRAKLEPYQLWRLLDKPVPVATLLSCVRDAAVGTQGHDGEASLPGLNRPVPLTVVPSESQTADQSSRQVTEVQQRAITEYFDGQVALYQSYCSACMTQFPADIASGIADCAANDIPSLGRLAHNLKTVLLTLGYAPQSALARDLEFNCKSGESATAQRQWRALCVELQQILKTHSPC